MAKIDDYLFILGLDSGASAIELKTAYRREISKWHPDRFHNDPTKHLEANERAKSINVAYEHLSELLDFSPLPSTKTAQTSKTYTTYRTQHTYNRKSFTLGFPDPTVFEVFLKSSNIVSTGYNSITGTLYIKFEGNVIYSYFNVPESVFLSFVSADSHGKFAHRNIYPKYKSFRGQ